MEHITVWPSKLVEMFPLQNVAYSVIVYMKGQEGHENSRAGKA